MSGYFDHIEGDPLIVASISGGKDSAALSLWLTEQGIEHERVFADTGWEAQETYDYLRGPLTDKIGPITEVRSDKGGLADIARHKGIFPSRIARWCTKELKIKPLFSHIYSRAEKTGLFIVNAVGVRAAESQARSKLPEWDGHSSKRGDFDVWRPLIRWTEEDVIDIHQRHGLLPNPLYFAGVERVGCWPCIHSRKSEIRLISQLAPERIDLIEQLESQVNEVKKAKILARGEDYDETHPSAFFWGRLAREGATASSGIRDVVEWSKTARGGRQLLLIDEPDPEGGCVRWGMCEHPENKGDE